jgi:hypothetical protein
MQDSHRERAACPPRGRALSPAHAGVRYRLTPYGRTLGPVFTTLWQWGIKHLARSDTMHGTRIAPPRSAPYQRLVDTE